MAISIENALHRGVLWKLKEAEGYYTILKSKSLIIKLMRQYHYLKIY